MIDNRTECTRKGTAKCQYLNFELMKQCSDFLMKVIEAVGIDDLMLMSDEGKHIYNFLWNFKLGRKRTKQSWFGLVSLSVSMFDTKLQAYYGLERYLQLVHEEHRLQNLLFFGKLSECMKLESLEAEGYLEWSARRKEEFHKLCPRKTMRRRTFNGSCKGL